MAQIKSTQSRGNYVASTASFAVNRSSVLKNIAGSLKPSVSSRKNVSDAYGAKKLRVV